MPEKQKPKPATVKAAANALKHPETATSKAIKGMSGRILDDQKNDPQPHGRQRSPRGRWLGQ